MKKTFLAAGALALFALAPMARAQSSVTLYGVLDGSVGYEHSSGGSGVGPNVSSGRVSFNDSYFGLRGSEDLGGGFKAIFQIESSIGSDGRSAPGYNASGSSGFADRNSRVGVESPEYGTLFLGHWETPYLQLSKGIDPFYGEQGSLHSMLGSSGYAPAFAQNSAGYDANAQDAAFNRRQGNSVQYWSPQWQGLQAKLGYSFSDSSNLAGSDGSSHAQALSASLDWNYRGLTVGYAYERHNDFYGIQAMTTGSNPAGYPGGSHDDAHKVVAAYDFGNGLQLGAGFEHLAYRSDADSVAPGAIDSFSRNAVVASAKYNFTTADAVKLGYGRAFGANCGSNGAACNATGSTASLYSVGYSHDLSKRTELYAVYSRIDNGQNASYTPAFGTDYAVNPGATYQFVGVGMRHAF
jgi:predicted porin